MMIIGIDACNIRQGGGLIHLNSLLRESFSQKHRFNTLIVWSNTKTLEYLPNYPWIIKKSNWFLNSNFIFAFFFQIFILGRQLRINKCEVVLVPGGTFFSSFSPFIAISQNLLPFELHEAFRYKNVLKKVKFIFLRMSQSYTFSRANGLIFLTNYAKLVIGGSVNFTSNSCVIPHGIDTNFLKYPNIQRPLHEYSLTNPFVLLYVSILSPYKHQSIISAAVCELYNKGIPVKLILVGPADPESLLMLKQVMGEFPNSSNCINYMGPIDHENLLNYYHASDGFIFGSTCENLPIILVEAMSTGLPILASYNGAVSEVLGPNHNFFFNPLDKEETELSILNFLRDNKGREQSAVSSFNMSRNYTWSNMASNTFEFIFETKIKH
jgi:glycosyltransferase involved in cell wall biosynthesis